MSPAEKDFFSMSTEDRKGYWICLQHFAQSEFTANLKPDERFTVGEVLELVDQYPEIWKEYDNRELFRSE